MCMKTKDKLIVNPTFNDMHNDIHIVIDEDGDEYWCANHMNSFVPSKRLDHFMANADTKEFLAIVERIIIPGKSGVIAKKGKGGGTYFHRLIALRFAAWLSKDFEVQVYLAYDQGRKYHTEWTKERALTKYEYRLMTDAIQQNLISRTGETYPYAREAMLINLIVFGAEKFEKNPREMATIEQLGAIKSLERYNATFIEMDMPFEERKSRLIELHAKKNLKQIGVI